MFIKFIIMVFNMSVLDKVEQFFGLGNKDVNYIKEVLGWNPERLNNVQAYRYILANISGASREEQISKFKAMLSDFERNYGKSALLGSFHPNQLVDSNLWNMIKKQVGNTLQNQDYNEVKARLEQYHVQDHENLVEGSNARGGNASRAKLMAAGQRSTSSDERKRRADAIFCILYITLVHTRLKLNNLLAELKALDANQESTNLFARSMFLFDFLEQLADLAQSNRVAKPEHLQNFLTGLLTLKVTTKRLVDQFKMVA